MAEQTLKGSCLCQSVRYEVSTPFMRFGHCYCSRCRKATGGVRSTNIAVPIAQFHWTQGENLVRRFDLPEAKSFARQICATCNCPIPPSPMHRATALALSFLPERSTMCRRENHQHTATGAVG